MTHTPGPWRISDFEIRAESNGRVIMGIDDFAVASVTERSRAENHGNAQLIAAAPDLLNLVQRYLRYHDGLVRCETADQLQECGCAVCCDARDTVAKVSNPNTAFQSGRKGANLQSWATNQYRLTRLTDSMIQQGISTILTSQRNRNTARSAEIIRPIARASRVQVNTPPMTIAAHKLTCHSKQQYEEIRDIRRRDVWPPKVRSRSTSHQKESDC